MHVKFLIDSVNTGHVFRIESSATRPEPDHMFTQSDFCHLWYDIEDDCSPVWLIQCYAAPIIIPYYMKFWRHVNLAILKNPYLATL